MLDSILTRLNLQLETQLRSMNMVLHQELKDHFQSHEFTVPSKASLYRYRVYADLCSMLYCSTDSAETFNLHFDVVNVLQK